jgi:tetratricopeptide (TPR) repeat protein
MALILLTACGSDSASDLDRKGVEKFNAGELQEAISLFDRALKKDENLAVGYFHRGRAFGELGDRDAEVADYEKARMLESALNPEDREALTDNLRSAYIARGKDRLKEKHYESAELDLMAAEEIEPSVELYLLLGEIFTAAENYDKRVGAYESALTLEFPLDSTDRAKVQGLLRQAYIARATERLGSRDFLGAVKDLEAAQSINPAAEVYLTLGDAQVAAGNRQGAASSYARAVELFPDFTRETASREAVLAGILLPQSTLTYVHETRTISPSLRILTEELPTVELMASSARIGQPAWSPDNSYLAVGCGEAVCILEADGTLKASVSCHHDSPPAWAADGQRFAIVCLDPASLLVISVQGEKQVLKADEVSGMQVAPGLDRAAWSPRSNEIAFSRCNQTRSTCAVFVVDAGSGGERLLVTNAERAAWSPDGQWLAVSRGSTTWLVKPDGSALRQLTAGWYAVWSPDGSSLALVGDRGPRIVGLGGEAREIPLGFPFGCRGSCYTLSWAPDGSRLALEMLVEGQSPAIQVYDLASGQAIGQPFPGRFPQWR